MDRPKPIAGTNEAEFFRHSQHQFSEAEVSHELFKHERRIAALKLELTVEGECRVALANYAARIEDKLDALTVVVGGLRVRAAFVAACNAVRAYFDKKLKPGSPE